MRLLVLEDELAIAESLKENLERIGLGVDVVDSVELGACAMRSIFYELLVLDRQVRDGDGLQLLKMARDAGLSTLAIIVTGQSKTAARIDGLNRGADDYLTKPFEMAEFLARVRALLRRSRPMVASKLTAGNLEFDVATRSVRVGGQEVVVARRETMLLEQLMRRPRQIVTREKLEGVLFGLDGDASQNAIEASVSRLRKILTNAAADQRVTTIRGVGYCLVPIEAAGLELRGPS